MDTSLAPIWPLAPGWSLFLGSAGRLLIVAGILFFIASMAGWVLSDKREALAKLGRIGFTAGCLCIFGAIFSLGVLFVKEQFEYETVRLGIEKGLELKYRIAAIWAHQEGSFLLWATTSAIFGLLVVRGTGPYRKWFTVAYAGFLASLCGILAYQTPFKLALVNGQALLPPNGEGLTPALQNYWVVIHPPTIFMGFGSLTVMACYAISAMLSGDTQGWVQRVRPWALVSVAVLGLGLCMGGFWAYETLGWGGFWAWDPVENVSFVPWILTATFVHGIIVQTARGRWVATNLLLGGMPFLAFVYGTFLTRSGWYADVSVHSFAQMEKSALWILLGFLVVATVGFFGLWFWKGRRAVSTERPDSEGANREGLYRTGMLLLGGIGVATAVGMSVPLFMAILGQKTKVVEEHAYHSVLLWAFVPMMLLIAAAPFASWRAMTWRKLGSRIVGIASIAFMFTGLAMFIARHPLVGVGLESGETIVLPFGVRWPVMPAILTLLFLCLFAATANIWRIIESFRRSKLSIGGFISHLGVATLMAGMVLSRGFERKDTAYIQDGRPAVALNYLISYQGLSDKDLLNRDNKALFQLSHVEPSGQEVSFTARPGLYYLPGDAEQPQAMTWPHIERQASHDIYVALHSPELAVWKDPMQVAPGKSVELNNVKVAYDKMVVQGKPGQIGVQFGVNLNVSVEGQTFQATPTLKMTSQGLEPKLASAGPDLMVALEGLNPADKSATIQIYFAKPVYPIEVFYKPMTILVWLGAGILTLGGLLSAWYRRHPRAGGIGSAVETGGAEEPSDAVAPVAQM